MTLFAAKILSPGAWAGKRRVASVERERQGPDDSEGIEAGRHSNRRANCSNDNREPASLSCARKPGCRFSNKRVTSVPPGTASNVAVSVISPEQGRICRDKDDGFDDPC
jgi:hypothetical protein